MAEKKRYYWLKLMSDFFTQPRIKKLRRIAGGDTYTIIYLKLQLLSMNDDAHLFYEGIEPTFAEELALTLDEDAENIEVTLKFLHSQGLIEELSPNEYLLTETQRLIGSEAYSTERSRRSRANKMLQCNTNATQMQPIATLSNEEIDKEIEIDKELEKEIDKDIYIPYQEVIEYLNLKANTSYRFTTKKTKNLIHARFNEGFTLDDFKKVIDIKCSEWMNTTMNQYLRPETLFGPKFEGYLNQKPKPMTNAQVMDAIIRGEMVLNESEGSNGYCQSNPIGVSYEN